MARLQHGSDALNGQFLPAWRTFLEETLEQPRTLARRSHGSRKYYLEKFLPRASAVSPTTFFGFGKRKNDLRCSLEILLVVRQTSCQ
jgi:hypothetical protein